ncbi:MAG: aldo/keto reductase [Bacteroidales bacterium]|nr:aldo/keto reductase [Bacteroidales bacterium]
MLISDIKGTTTLSNGIEMPYFGLGVFETRDGNEVINAVKYAIKTGYRHIDTASMYQNEKGVGLGIKQSGVEREDIFVTSKVWNTDQGFDKTIQAFDLSLKKLGFDYLDLYLIHWPVKGMIKETWQAFEYLYKEGRVRAIGVSNFLKHHLEELFQNAEIKPMVNQMEFHPHLVQQDLIDFCNANKIQYEAWSPLMRGAVNKISIINQLAEKYNKNAFQIVLRWNLQKGVVTIPKSSRPDRILSNSQLFDFEIEKADIQLIDSLDKNSRLGPHPDFIS